MHVVLVQFLKVAVAHLLAVVSPGPDFALVLRQSLHHGRRTALWTSLGIGTAILLHVTYSLLGLGLLLRSSPIAFAVVKMAGATYLAWIGVWALVGALGPGARAVSAGERAGGEPGAPGQGACADGEAAPACGPPGVSPGRAWGSGFLTNALNPKATLFFVVLFSSVAGAGLPKAVLAGFGLWMAVTTGAWFALVSTLFTRPRARAAFLRCRRAIDTVLGLVFVLLAGLLAAATV